MYAIARRLTLAARRETAEFFAKARESSPACIRARKNDGDLCCPLGYALEQQNTPALRFHSLLVENVPTAIDVQDALNPNDNDIYKEARRFTDDWDRLRITDIHTAFGLKRKGQAPCATTETPTATSAPLKP